MIDENISYSLDPKLPDDKREYTNQIKRMLYFLEMQIEREKDKAVKDIEDSFVDRRKNLANAVNKSESINYLESIGYSINNAKELNEQNRIKVIK